MGIMVVNALLAHGGSRDSAKAIVKGLDTVIGSLCVL